MYNLNEIWKPITNYEGLYEISNTGRVKSIRKNKILKRSNVTSYFRVILAKGNKKYTLSAHRLVAEAFIPNPHNKPQVNHINGIKNDNRVENLEWVTQFENMKHAIEMGLLNAPKGGNHYKAKLSTQQINEIKNLFTNNTYTRMQLSKKYNVSYDYIAQVINGQRRNKGENRFAQSLTNHEVTEQDLTEFLNQA